MNKLIALLALFSLSAQAGLPPTSSRGAADATNVTTFNYLFPGNPVTHAGVSATVLPPSTSLPNFIGQDATWKPINTADRDLEASVGNWLAFANTVPGAQPDNGMTGGTPSVTCTRSTVAPAMDGTAWLEIVKGASNRQGDGCSVVFNVQPAYQGQTVTISAPMKIASGTIVQGDVKLFVYDVTNSQLITPSNNDVLANGTLTATFPTTASAATPANQQYRLGIYFASTVATAVTLHLDNFSVSPGQAVYGAAGSNWNQSLTFTPSAAAFGTLTTTFYESQRDKDSLHVRGYFTAGSANATAAFVALPQAMDPAKVNASGRKMIVGGWTVMTSSGTAGTNTPRLMIADPANLSNVYFAVQSQSGAFPVNTANDIMSAGDSISFDFTVPIAGWDANVSMANSSTFKISSYLANNATPVSGTPSNLGEWKAYRRNASANTYATTTATPSALPSVSDGIKIWNAAWASGDSVNQPSKYEIFVGKNKTVSYQYYSTAGRTGVFDPAPNYSSTFYVGMVKNYDPTTGIVTLTGINGSGSTAGAAVGWDGSNGTVGPGFFDLVVSENALAVGIAPNPTAQIGLTSNFAVTASNPIKYDTVLSDSHLAYSTSTGLYTVPMAGTYRVSFTGLTTSASMTPAVAKNGAAIVQLASVNSTTVTGNSQSVKCNQGDTLAVNANGTATMVGGAGPYSNYISIERVGN